MTTSDIISKLSSELEIGIRSEVQAVYLLAGIRKLMERDGVKGEYPNLNFHCDWALHSKLEGSGAKRVLCKFDAAHFLLRDQKLELRDLPPDLKADLDRISKMTQFREELSRFLNEYGLPPLTKNLDDGWARFLHLYAKIVEDIPLAVVGATSKHIRQVVVHFEEAPKKIGGQVLFKVTWTIHDKNGQSGEIFVINSFDG
jgi:hypothetical protein